MINTRGETMGKTLWFIMISLDGFEADRKGSIDFHIPSEEVHQFINMLNDSTAAMILDRSGYDIMKYWDDPPADDQRDEPVRAYAEQWKHIKKIIVADDIDALQKDNYSIWPELTAARIDSLLAETPGDVLIGSASLAWALLRLKKLSGIQIITVPILLGAGDKNYADAGEIPLALIDHKIFENGWTYAHYKVLDEI